MRPDQVQIMVKDAAKSVCDPDRALLYWWIDPFNRGYMHLRTAEMARAKAGELRALMGVSQSLRKPLHWVVVDRRQIVEYGMCPGADR